MRRLGIRQVNWKVARHSTQLWLFALGVVAVSYFTLRPETVGLTPNPTDPFFYTGYQTNFDDLIAALGQDHYIVTRWSSYLPGLVFNQVFGPINGRIFLRWLMFSAMLLAVWRTQPDWEWSQRIIASASMLTLPMFWRAMMTDYVEYAVVFYGLLIVSLALKPEIKSYKYFVAAGFLSGLMIIANPFSLTIAVPPLILMTLIPLTNVRVIFCRLVVIGVSVVSIALGGLLYFHWFHDLPNIYKPTLQFFSLPRGRDPLMSPNLLWLRHFTWIYAVPLVLIVAATLRRLGITTYSRTESLAFSLCGFQYLLQWFDHFIRSGGSLEIPYYWSYILPSFCFSLAFLSARLLADKHLLVALWVIGSLLFLLLTEAVKPGLLPSGVGALVMLGVTGIVVIVASTKLTKALGAALILFTVFTLQVGAPIYDPTPYHPYNLSPRLSLVFNQPNSLAERVYRSALWFEDRVDTLEDDYEAHFIIAGGFSSIIVGVYAPQITGRGIPLDNNLDLLPATLDTVRSGDIRLIVIYGMPPTVISIKDKLLASLVDTPLEVVMLGTDELGHELSAIQVFVTPEGLT